MALFRTLVLALTCTQLLSLCLAQITIPPELDGCDFDAADQGPYTYKYCDSPTATCAFCLPATPPASKLKLTDTSLEPVAYNLTDREYLNFRLLEIAYTTEFAKNPLPWEDPVDLPFCRVQDEQPPAARRSEVEARSEVSKRSILSGYIDDWFPKAPAPPEYPTCIPRKITVPIFYTIFTSNCSSAALVTQEVLAKQTEQINFAFAALGISFVMQDPVYRVGPEYRAFAQQRRENVDAAYTTAANKIKRDNRSKGYDELNIWIVEGIDTPDCTTGVRTSGYCTFPDGGGLASNPIDGCVIVLDSLPGVEYRNRPRVAGDGTVLTHEIGHWVGLKHVFPSDPGSLCKPGVADGITDTVLYANGNPPMFDEFQRPCCFVRKDRTIVVPGGFTLKVPFFTWDFCPPSFGVHHVTNFMSYSPAKGVVDKPNFGLPWTRGQRTLAFSTFFSLRRPVGRAGIDRACLDYPLFKYRDTAGTVIPRVAKRQITGEYVLEPTPFLLASLELACSTPYDPEDELIIDQKTGEIIRLPKCDFAKRGKKCFRRKPWNQIGCDNGSNPPCIEDSGVSPEISSNHSTWTYPGSTKTCLGCTAPRHSSTTSCPGSTTTRSSSTTTCPGSDTTTTPGGGENPGGQENIGAETFPGGKTSPGGGKHPDGGQAIPPAATNSVPGSPLQFTGAAAGKLPRGGRGLLGTALGVIGVFAFVLL